MKLKPLEILLIIFAVIFATGAIAAQQIEPKDDEHAEETAENEQQAPEEFFVDAETVEHESLEVNEPEQAQQTVQQFFTLFTQINTNPNDTQIMMQAKSLLSNKLQSSISSEQSQATRDLARLVGILTPPKNVTILRTEQTSPEKIDVIVEVTTDNDQKVQKRISTIQEDNIQKIDAFTILE